MQYFQKSVHAHTFLWKRKLIIKSLGAYSKTFNNSKDFSELWIYVTAPFAQFSPGHSRLSEQFQNNRRLSEQLLDSPAATWKPEQAPWRGLLEAVWELFSDFKEANRNFIYNFIHKKGAKYCETHQRSYKKYWYEKNIHLVALSLSSSIFW